MTKSAGLGLLEVATVFDTLRPDCVVVVGDRYDVLPVAIAAVYMNIMLAHTMGGEVTGTIDESIRHALTKLAHLHFTANEDARQRVIRLGEQPETVFNVGCPRIDLVKRTIDAQCSKRYIADNFNNYRGVGGSIDFTDNFLLVSYHPVTTEYGKNFTSMEKILEVLQRVGLPTLLLWPNSDAGADEVSRAVRTFRERTQPNWLHVCKDLPAELYIHLLNVTVCLIGNSSSGIREGAFLGVPVVNIGSRQSTRAHAQNVMSVSQDEGEIESMIYKQINHGRYTPNTLYGNGDASGKIADVLSRELPPLQKKIAY
jgi:UDP-hydrolysing UDP-N-acetyl-D-glucosamine 2-epimerase